MATKSTSFSTGSKTIIPASLCVARQQHDRGLLSGGDEPTSLTYAQKRALLERFNNLLEQRVAAMTAGAGDDILANVPLAPNIMQRITDAAASKHETPAKWMAEVLGKAATGQK